MKFDNEMNTLEAMKYIKEKLLEQGEQASYRTANKSVPQCKYRTKKGLKCAVGMLIPEEDYDESFEHKTIHEIRLALTNWMPNVELNALENAQSVHDYVKQGDENTWIENIEYGMNNLIERYEKLNVDIKPVS